MAVFNPNQPQVQAPTTWYMAGSPQASRTFSTLFGEGGSLMTDYAKAKDTQTQTDIYNDALAQNQAANAPYAAALKQAGYTDLPGTGNNPSPGVDTKAGRTALVAGASNASGGASAIGDLPAQTTPTTTPGYRGSSVADVAAPPVNATSMWDPTTRTSASGLFGPGLDPTVTGSNPAGPAPGTATGAPMDLTGAPPEIQQGANQMQKLQIALAGGGISPAYRDNQQLNIENGLRAKYPGYNKEIDSIVKQVTGHDPGDALVSDFYTEAQKNATAATTAAGNWQTWTEQKDNATALGQLGIDVRDPKYQTPAGQADAKHQVAQKFATDANQAARAQADATAEADNTLTGHQMRMTGIAFAGQLDTQGGATLNNTTGMNATLDAFAKDPSSVDMSKVGPAFLQQINVQESTIQGQVQTWLDAPVNPADPSRTRASFMSAQDVADIKANAVANLENIKERIVNKDFGAASYFANQNTIIKQQAENSIYAQSQSVAVAAGLGATGAPSNVVSMFTNPGTPLGDQISKDSHNLVIGMDVTAATKASGSPGGGSVTGAIKAFSDGNPNISPEEQGAAAKQHLDDMRAAIQDPKTDPKALANMVDYMFGPANGNFLADIVPKGQWSAIYGELTSPATSKAIWNASQNNPKLWGEYTGWVENNARAAAGAASADLNSAITGVPGSTITYDGDKHQFTYTGKAPTPPKGLLQGGSIGDYSLGATLDRANQARVNDLGQAAVVKINTVISNVAQMAALDGTDPNAAVQSVVKSLGIDPNAAKIPSAIQGLNQAVNDWAAKNVQAGGEEPNATAPRPIDFTSSGQQAAASSGPSAQAGASPAAPVVSPGAGNTPADALGETGAGTSGPSRLSPPSGGVLDKTAFHPGIQDNYQPTAAAIPSGQATLAAQPATPGSVSDLTVNSVKQWEEGGTAKLSAYNDGFGTPTIGYGHTGSDVKMGTTITQAQADTYLKQDLQASSDNVDKLVKVPLTEGQKTALTSFDFNEGDGALAKSTLLQKINAGDMAGAAQEFNKWVYAKGPDGNLVYVPGLQNRRNAEIAMFNGGGTAPDQIQTAMNINGPAANDNNGRSYLFNTPAALGAKVDSKTGQPVEGAGSQNPTGTPANVNAAKPKVLSENSPLFGGAPQLQPVNQGGRLHATSVADTVPSQDQLTSNIAGLKALIDKLGLAGQENSPTYKGLKAQYDQLNDQLRQYYPPKTKTTNT